MGEGRYKNKDSAEPEGERKNDRKDICYRTQPVGEGRYKNKDSVRPDEERKNDRKDIYYRTQPKGEDTGIKTV